MASHPRASDGDSSTSHSEAKKGASEMLLLQTKATAGHIIIRHAAPQDHWILGPKSMLYEGIGSHLFDLDEGPIKVQPESVIYLYVSIQTAILGFSCLY